MEPDDYSNDPAFDDEADAAADRWERDFYGRFD